MVMRKPPPPMGPIYDVDSLKIPLNNFQGVALKVLAFSN